MKASHLLVLVPGIALLAWIRPAPTLPQEPRGKLELRNDLLALNFLRPGSSASEVRVRLGKPHSVERLPEGSEIWTFQDEKSVTTVYLSEGRVTGLSGFGLGARLSGYEAQSRAGIEDIFGPSRQKTVDTITYAAGERTVTFLFGGCGELLKTTLY